MFARRKRFKVFLFIVFFVISFSLMIPGSLLAQEGETSATDEITEETEISEELTTDVIFNEVVDYGIIGTTFEFRVDVNFTGSEEKLFVFESEAPSGWTVTVSPQYQDITLDAVNLKPGNMESLKVLARPKVEKDPGEYDIKFTVKDPEEGSDLKDTVELKAIVKPVGDLVFTTQSGRLNTEVVKEEDNSFILVLDNIGSGPVEDITLSIVDSPPRWLIDFNQDKIKVIDVNKPANIEIKIVPAEKTIAGDYMIRVMAQSEKSTTHIDIRATVKVPLVWQIIGIAIIVIVIAGMGVLFYRLGKR